MKIWPLLFITILPSLRLFAVEEARIESGIEFRPGIAAVVAEGKNSLGPVVARFARGSLKSDTLHFAVRVVDSSDRSEIVWIRVMEMDDKGSAIKGRISNVLPEWTGRSREDRIKFNLADVIGWKIEHADGSVEGNVLGNYCDTQSTGWTRFELLRDKRQSDVDDFSTSVQTSATVDQFFLRIFGGRTAAVEHLKGSSSLVEEWPGLVQAFQGISRPELLALVRSNADALKASGKIVVEDTQFLGKSLVLITATIFVKRAETIFQVQQVLRLNFDSKDKFNQALWGMRSARTVRLKKPSQ